MKLEDILRRIEELIVKGNNLVNSQYRNEDGFYRIDSSEFMGLKSATQSLILKIFTREHPYFTEIQNITYYYYPSSAENIVSVLTALKEEVAGGWLFTTKGIVSSEIFADFLEMAEHLLDEGYKDPAAVMIGSVLEEHLRQLCIKNEIAIEFEKEGKMIPIKADKLNSDLASAQIYNKLDQKNVTAWLDLRNKAAHGKYSEYSKEQVSFMFNAVSDFLVRNTI